MYVPKPIISLLAILLFCLSAHGQNLSIDACEPGSAFGTLDNGVIHVQARNESGFREWGGAYFTLPGFRDYEIPILSDLWVSGFVDDSLRVSGGAWHLNYWPGALGKPGTNRPTCDSFFDDWNRIWAITRAETASEPPTAFNSGIEDWPVQWGAPFASSRSDGTYDPEEGDRPVVHGDRMLWWTLTDLGNNRQPDGQSVGLTVQVMPYLFDRSDIAGRTVFVRYMIRNENAVPVNDALIGLWMDGMMELNGPVEAAASDSLLGLAYHFFVDNRWDDPEDAPDSTLFPALGATALRARKQSGDEIPLRAIMTLYGDNYQIGVQPHAESIRNLMDGRFEDGSPVHEGGGVLGMGYPPDQVQPHESPPGEKTTRFMFSGDPVERAFWSIYDTDGQGTPYGNSRSLSITLSHGPFDIEPGEEIEFVVAYVFGITDDHLASVTRLKQNTAALHQNADFLLEPSSFADPPFDPRNTGLRVSEGFPNPSSDKIAFWHDIEGSLRIRIVDVQGRVRLAQRWTNEPLGRISLDISTLPSGIYAARFDTPRTNGSRMFVVRH